ncbi:mucin-2-like, partial [Musca vetustissima]|uniref:mucin-2-like n=1 Tax=Musca vetustissima TaxID=27455 RepID=UPI002AB7275E
DTPKGKTGRLETTVEVGGGSSAVCPWDEPDEPPTTQAPKPVPAAAAVVPAASTTPVQLSVCPWEQEEDATVPPATTTAAAAHLPAIKTSAQRLTSTSSDNSEVSDRLQRNLGIRHQNTVDSGETSGMKRLLPNFTEQRRASVSFTPSRISEFPTGRPSTGAKISTTPSPTVTLQQGNISALFAPIQGPNFAATAVVTKDPPSSSDAEVEEELNKLAISERNSESSGSAVLPTPNPTPTPPPVTKVTPPPVTPVDEQPAALVSAETQTCHADDSPRESSPSDSLHGNEPEERSGGNEAEFEAEVDSEIQEVQIELIESSEGYEKLCESQECLEMSPPTIQVDEDNGGGDGGENISPPHGSGECLAGDTEMVEDTPSKQKTPSGSAKQSPEKEIAPEPQETGEEKQSPLQEQDLPQQPIPPPPTTTTQEELPPTSPTEELSPTTDEYQEGLEFGDDGKNDFDIADSESTVGYIPPAPTPAPSMAPLAEMDTDTVDEEFSEELKPKETATATTTPVAEKPSKLPHTNVVKTTAEEARKKRKKRHLDAKKSISGEEKEKEKASTSAAGVASATTVVKETSSAKPEADLTTVCPWEDENVTTSDGTFTKTYATLGYL